MKMVMTRRAVVGSSIALAGFSVLGLTPAHAADPAVTAIQNYYSRLVSAMQQASGLSVQQRYQKLAPILSSAFDFGTMVRLSVGPAFSQASGAQQAALRTAFERFTGAYYANRIDGYSGEKFEVDPVPESRGGQKIVKTKLVRPGGGSNVINYLVSGSRVIDIYLDGSISEVASRRGEFTSILASGGPQALIQALQDKTAKLLAG